MFAQRGWSSRIVLDTGLLRPVAPGCAQALDTGSRAGSLDALGARTVELTIRHLAAAEVAFLKIDSLLRGHVASDVRTVLAAGPWTRIVITPAFPERGRSFVDGIVRVDGTAVTSFQGAGLSRSHVNLASLRSGDAMLASAGVHVVDAETDEDMERIAGSGTHLDTLWVGSAGLARALTAGETAGETVAPRTLRADLPIVTVVGSRTGLARRQMRAALDRNSGLRHVEVAPESLLDPDLPPTLALDQEQSVILSIAGQPTEGEGDELLVRSLARAVASHDEKIGGLVIVGGQTARAILLALDLGELAVVGELEPGIALCSDEHDRPVITKSGSFGDDATLHRIHRSLGA